MMKVEVARPDDHIRIGRHVQTTVGRDSIPVRMTLNRENPVSNPTAVASNLWQV